MDWPKVIVPGSGGRRAASLNATMEECDPPTPQDEEYVASLSGISVEELRADARMRGWK